MKQMTPAAAKGFEMHGRTTRKAEFPARMEALVPWAQFCALVEPHFPKAGGGGPPRGMKLHIGVDSQSGLIHSTSGTAGVRYRGLSKNANRAFAMLALINLSKWGRPLAGQVRLA